MSENNENQKLRDRLDTAKKNMVNANLVCRDLTDKLIAAEAQDMQTNEIFTDMKVNKLAFSALPETHRVLYRKMIESEPIRCFVCYGGEFVPYEVAVKKSDFYPSDRAVRIDHEVKKPTYRDVTDADK